MEKWGGGVTAIRGESNAEQILNFAGKVIVRTAR
jgi:hypothetical protein